MAGPWICERDDGDGAYVYYDESPDETAPEGHPTELDAWEYALDCLLARREGLSLAVRTARKEVGRCRKATPQAEQGAK
ncbi:hypothetical protein D1604_12510 [Brevundimonas sp. LPMIX5]|nr:hypothetical protein D1604_12510 [Brevundimonas sp. LPMIX5]